MPMTNAERQKRKREKAKMLGQHQALVDGSAGPGGLDRLSKMVRDKVATAVEAGELTPTIGDGLKAEANIMRRAAQEAKQEDTKLIIGIFRLLAGDFEPPVALIEDGNTVEGTFEEVEDGPEAATD